MNDQEFQAMLMTEQELEATIKRLESDIDWSDDTLVDDDDFNQYREEF